MLIEDFIKSKICNSLSWAKVYAFLGCTIAFGRLTASAAAEKFCGYCVKRFSEHAAKRRDHFYESKECGDLLRDRYPVAQSALLFFKKVFNSFWCSTLEMQGGGDY